MKEPDCGGCKGQGAHSRRCRTQPGWLWERLYDDADDLANMIGSNDHEAANMAYAIAGRMRAKAEAARNPPSYAPFTPADPTTCTCVDPFVSCPTHG